MADFDPTIPPPGTDPKLFARIMAMVTVTDGCWLWAAATDTSGYGNPKVNGKGIHAHRLTWQFFIGPIPHGILVLHKCDIRRCVRPDHLFLGTQADNMADMKRKNRGSHGEAHRLARLTATDIPLIRKAYRDGETMGSIGDRHGVSSNAIWRILHGITWRHVQ